VVFKFRVAARVPDTWGSEC